MAFSANKHYYSGWFFRKEYFYILQTQFTGELCLQEIKNTLFWKIIRCNNVFAHLTKLILCYLVWFNYPFMFCARKIFALFKIHVTCYDIGSHLLAFSIYFQSFATQKPFFVTRLLIDLMWNLVISIVAIHAAIFWSRTPSDLHFSW